VNGGKRTLTGQLRYDALRIRALGAEKGWDLAYSARCENAADEIERLQNEKAQALNERDLFKSNEQGAHEKARAKDVEIERLRAELTAWRDRQDGVAHLVCKYCRTPTPFLTVLALPDVDVVVCRFCYQKLRSKAYAL
jgi:hypothetical protein